MDQLTTLLPVALFLGGGALVYNQCIAKTGKKETSIKAGGKSHTRATDEDDEIDLDSFMTAKERKELKNKKLHAEKQAILLEKQRKENADIEKREREAEKTKKAEKAALEALSPKDRKAQALKNKNNTNGDAKSIEAKKKEKEAQKKKLKDEQKARELAMAKKLGLAASETKKAAPVQKVLISEDEEDDGFKTAASKKQRQRIAQKLQKQQDREENDNSPVSYTPMSANNDDDVEDAEEEKVVVEKVTVLVPVQFERRLIIIGKGAETIEQIKQKTDCYISVPQEDTRDGAQLYNNAPIYIKVNGPKDSAAVARKIILELAELGHSPTLNNISGLMESKFKCEVKQRAMVLGPGGSWLKTLQNSLDVKIIMPHRLSMDTEIVITGPKNGVMRCKKALSQLLRDGYSPITHPGWLKSSISIHSSLHRRLIGRAGSVIKRIQNDSGAKIMLPSDNGDYVYVLGSPESIARATVIINELVEEFETAEEERQYKKDRLDDDYEDEIDEESMQYLYQGNF